MEMHPEEFRRLTFGMTRGQRREFARTIKGGRVLQRGLPGTSTKVRNVSTGRVLPCCWGPCERDGDDRVQVQVPHDQPRWPGEKLIYIFCSDLCRGEWLKGTPQDYRVK